MTHVYETLAQVFVREGVRDCFALLGDANMAFATALADQGVTMTYVRHEHCAVAAATAYARKAGTVGVATVTCGPGLTQVMTALPAAVRASIPLVILAGEAPIGSPWYNQGIAQGPFVQATGARYHALHHVPRMAEAIRDAFVEAAQDRVPVVLGVPFDLQYQSHDLKLPVPSAQILPDVLPCPPHPDAVARIASEIDGAQRIVVMAGMGALDAVEEATALADHLGALLATTLPARGLFHGHPFHVGVAGGFSSTLAVGLFAEADLLIALGCRLAQHTLAKGTLFPKARVIQIDTDPQARVQGATPASLHLKGDARLSARALLDQVQGRPGWRTPRLSDAIAQAVSDTATFPPEQGVLDPRDVVTALDKALPTDWQMVNSSGHCSFYFAHMDRPHATFLTIREFGAIGNGTSYAMGVARACPGETVVLLDGDGSLLMHVQELETMRRHGLTVLVCVLNDRAYGSEIHKLRDEGLSDAGAVFGATDLAAIARGFGVAGETVSDLDALPALVQRYAATGGVAVFDFPVSDRVCSPVIRRAHPTGHTGTEHPIDVEALL